MITQGIGMSVFCPVEYSMLLGCVLVRYLSQIQTLAERWGERYARLKQRPGSV
jgi:hypothetical protein